MPAEWEPHQGMLMAWPVSDAVWGTGLADAREAFARVAQSIARFERVDMVATARNAPEAQRLCGPQVHILELEHDDCWMRDAGPTFVIDTTTGERVALDWDFNAWGHKYPDYRLDQQLPHHLSRQLGSRRLAPGMVLEGGSIHTNGCGTLITTSECLLNPNRNPTLDQDRIEATLKEYLGVHTVIWLPWGLDGDETDGHVDNVCCFIDSATVLMPWTDDVSDPNYARLTQNREVLYAHGLDVKHLPQPPRTLHNGIPLTLSYVNFAFVNGGIVMPLFGGALAALDKEAAQALQKLFPQREVVGIETLPIIAGGGNIHCITQQVPQELRQEHAQRAAQQMQSQVLQPTPQPVSQGQGEVACAPSP
ncbi:MAG: agmatine deiminase family protein [Coriobacteriales bacterium]|jgi:agmatine deiminase|nr:agmatine deiminase family protein [Coriobacteriales bacterium]